MKNFSIKTGVQTLIIYTAGLSLFGLARGSEHTPGFWQRVILVAISGFLVGFFLNPLVQAIKGSSQKRFGALALLIFSLAAVSNALETILYLPATSAAAGIVGGIVEAVILSGALVWATQCTQIVQSAAKGRLLKPAAKILVIAALTVLWLPVYFLFETLDTPIVHLLEQANTSVFAHPHLAAIIALELVRGLIHALVMLWIISLAHGQKRTAWLWGALSIALLNGWVPILPTTTLPLSIRIANGVEITLSSIVFAGVAVWLFNWIRIRPNTNASAQRATQ